MLESLKKSVLDANLALVKHGLVIFTWGNVSAIDAETQLVAIKPSGVSYEKMRAEDIVVLDLNGNKIEGTLQPSTDTPTHLALYRAFPEQIESVVHTHSTEAVAWAQAGLDIPSLGTTHADYFHDAIPCTPDMTREEIFQNYEEETGNVIVKTLRSRGINPAETPGALVKNHGPFAWGKNCAESVHNAVVLEEIARMARLTRQINPAAQMNPYLIEKHYQRKHGKNAYYGQH